MILTPTIIPRSALYLFFVNEVILSEIIRLLISILQTYLHNLLSLSFGCTNYRIMASEVPAIVPGGLPTAIAGVMIHDEIVAEGTASSGKNAKVKASSQALKLLQNLAPFEYRHTYGCNCEGKEQDWVGKAGDGVGMAGQLKRGNWDEREDDLLRAKIAKSAEMAQRMEVP